MLFMGDPGLRKVASMFHESLIRGKAKARRVHH